MAADQDETPFRCGCANDSLGDLVKRGKIVIHKLEKLIVMNNDEKISTHYRHGSLLTAIQAGLGKQGIKPENASVEDLGPVDEFHIGGRAASINFLDQLEKSPSQTILDIGCGLGVSPRRLTEQRLPGLI